MTMCAFCFATVSLAFKLLPNIPPMQILWYRMFISVLIIYVIGHIYKTKIYIKNSQDHFNLVLRCSLYIPASVTWFYGLKFMPMSESIVLNLCSPIAAGILGSFILN